MGFQKAGVIHSSRWESREGGLILDSYVDGCVRESEFADMFVNLFFLLWKRDE